MCVPGVPDILLSTTIHLYVLGSHRLSGSIAQTGQGTMVWVEVTETVSRDAAVSRHHAPRRSEVVSGNTREKNAVPSMQVRGEKASILSVNRHPYG
jgi:hypothetical protein